jgi:hypothetical protein
MFDRFEPVKNIKIPSPCHLPHREQSHPQQANKTLDRTGYRRSVSFDVNFLTEGEDARDDPFADAGIRQADRGDQLRQRKVVGQGVRS